LEIPATRYARAADGDSIAYQVAGDGPFDLVYVPGFISQVELWWAEPSIARFYGRLASFSRLILFDKRGTGLSDPIPGPQPLEERMDDVRAVMDAAGSKRAAVVGLSEGSAMAAVFAATYPQRTSALVLLGPILGGTADEHPAGEAWTDACRRFQSALERWGDGSTLRLMGPTMRITDRQLGLVERSGASPRMARELIAMWLEIDLREVLPAVSVPTLVVNRSEEIFPAAAARELAARIPGARNVELPGIDHVPWAGDSESYVAEIEEFLTGVRTQPRQDRVLATILVTDLVASTERAAASGDEAWSELMARHDALVADQLQWFGGHDVKHTGDGILATFDGPARAIRCAAAIIKAARQELDLDVRAGLHTGEVELVDADLRGLAVHVAARISAEAEAGQVLVSRTTKELVIGSDLALAHHASRVLKGVPGEWPLFALLNGVSPPAPVLEHSRRNRLRLGDTVGLALARRAPRVLRAMIRAEQTAAEAARARRRR
jgi:pimeloyl-ACP methyl ester carboxylesterase/class 3 adenylate cyclase